MTEKSLEHALDVLRSALADHASADEVDDAVAGVAALDDAASIGPLLRLLDDQAEYDELMFSLIHAAEAFDDRVYAEHFVGVIGAVRTQAPGWASIVLMRILNNDNARTELVRVLSSASAQAREAVQWLCEAINQRDARFIGKTLAVLVASKA